MEISSVQDYISAIERLGFKYTIEQLTPHGRRLKTPRFIFRGHSNHEKYKVIPGILRYSVLQYSPLVEYNILSNFIIDSCRYLRDVPTGDILSWLEIAQHFGVPTRLLDFTSNPLVALYFACESKSEANASVWMVNTSAYNMIFSFDRANYAAGAERIANQIIRDEIVEFDSYDATSHSDPRKYSQYPLIYQPHYREERMSQQSSMPECVNLNAN